VEEVVRDAWVPARGKLMAGMAGKAPAAALSVDGGEKQSREVGDGDKGDFAISKNSRD